MTLGQIAGATGM